MSQPWLCSEPLGVCTWINDPVFNLGVTRPPAGRHVGGKGWGRWVPWCTVVGFLGHLTKGGLRVLEAPQRESSINQAHKWRGQAHERKTPLRSLNTGSLGGEGRRPNTLPFWVTFFFFSGPAYIFFCFQKSWFKSFKQTREVNPCILPTLVNIYWEIIGYNKLNFLALLLSFSGQPCSWVFLQIVYNFFFFFYPFRVTQVQGVRRTLRSRGP